jgi:hypothetical protein
VCVCGQRFWCNCYKYCLQIVLPLLYQSWRSAISSPSISMWINSKLNQVRRLQYFLIHASNRKLMYNQITAGYVYIACLVLHLSQVMRLHAAYVVTALTLDATIKRWVHDWKVVSFAYLVPVAPAHVEPSGGNIYKYMSRTFKRV